MYQSVTIDGLEFAAIKSATEQFMCSAKTGLYGSGIVDNPALIGVLGEAAVGKLLGLEPDLTYHSEGDGGIDLTLRLPEGTMNIDVKTSLDRSICYIRASVGKKIIPLTAKIYIFCAVRELTDTSATVEIFGWLSRSEITSDRSRNQASPVEGADWRNWVVWAEDTHSIDSIVDLAKNTK